MNLLLSYLEQILLSFQGDDYGNILLTAPLNYISVKQIKIIGNDFKYISCYEEMAVN